MSRLKSRFLIPFLLIAQLLPAAGIAANQSGPLVQDVSKRPYLGAVPSKDNAATQQQAIQAFGREDYQAAIGYTDAMIAGINDDLIAHYYKSVALSNLRRFEEARQYIRYHWMINGIDIYAYLTPAELALFHKDDMREAKRWMRQAMRLATDASMLAEIRGNVVANETFTGHPGRFAELADYAEKCFNEFGRGQDAKRVFDTLMQGLEAKNAGDAKATERHYSKAIGIAKGLEEFPVNAIAYMYDFAARDLNELGALKASMQMAREGLDYYTHSGLDNPYILAHLSTLLAALHNHFGQTDDALRVSDKAHRAIARQPFDYLNGNLLIERLKAYAVRNTDVFNDMKARAPELEEAQALLSVAKRMGEAGDSWRKEAFNVLGNVYSSVIKRAALTKAVTYYQQALQLGEKEGNQDFADAVRGNLAVAHYRLGDAKKAVALTRQVAQSQERRGDAMAAALSLNNLAGMLMYGKDYQAMIEPLEQAVAIIERRRDETPAELRRSLLEREISAYQFLIMAYGKLGRAQEAYRVMEQARGRALVEAMAGGGHYAEADLAWLRKVLAPDEAALLYTVAEKAGSVVIVVVTREGVNIAYPQQLDFHDRLARRFAKAYRIALRPPGQRGFNPFESRSSDEMTRLTSLLRDTMEKKTGLPAQTNDGVRDEVLKAYYGLLIAPIEKYLGGKKRLLISPDGYLSFIPFDALIDASGNYLAQRFQTRYTPSMAIFRLVKERAGHSGERRNILAFGDARYAPYAVDQRLSLATDESAFFELETVVDRSFRAGKSQRPNYARLGVTGKSWSYLEGTKIEVEQIAKRVPRVDLMLNKDFTENKIKSLSREGRLKDYRVLHLATHGMVVPTLPELSTVVASLPAREQDGEDGYLTAREIRDLKLGAEFVALSACQTGLGKIYAGDGVAGLNASLIEAGADATSVTLWSVSDYGTMRFMVGLYDLVYNQGLHYADAMAEMKRSFIRGEIKDGQGHVYDDPQFWAPFVYYGK